MQPRRQPGRLNADTLGPAQVIPLLLARLPREVLQLHLNSRDLSVNGSRQELVARLQKAYCRERPQQERGDGMGATPRRGRDD
jgi:hypothetical protein